MRLSAGFLALLVSVPALAKSPTTFLPPNNLSGERSLDGGGLTEQQFDDTISMVEGVYGPIVKAHGATLKINRLWTDDTVNSDASQPTATDWEINSYGGLARRPEVTVDGFALVVCHELGHHLGGFPFYSSDPWAADEGQADTHATSDCAYKIFKPNAELKALALAAIPADVQAKCDAHHATDGEKEVCYRTVAASKSLADLLAALEGSKVSFDTPDTSKVSTTNDDHPAAQCRLDTYVAGALCGNAKWDYTLIPGKTKADNNGLDAQAEAFAHSCEGDVETQRSRCWFAPVTADTQPAQTCPLGDAATCQLLCQLDPSQAWCH